MNLYKIIATNSKAQQMFNDQAVTDLFCSRQEAEKSNSPDYH